MLYKKTTLNYSDYWSILDSPSNSIKSDTVFLVISIVCLALWLLTKKYKKPSEEGDKIILLWSTAVFTILSFVGFFYMRFVYVDKSDEEIVNLLNSSKVEKVEGVISNFNRTLRHTKYTTITIESFNVDSVNFEYADALLGRFNSFTKTNNGIFQNGLPVRITYGKMDYNYSNKILKVEIGQYVQQ